MLVALWNRPVRHAAGRYRAGRGHEYCFRSEPELGGTGRNLRHATAYAVPSTDKGLGRPVVAYHYLDAGPVLGGFHQVSVTVGAFNRVEFGYTRNLHQDGSTAGLSTLWSSGFNAFHGKLNFLPERRAWQPALSVGFVARSQVRNVGGVIQGQDTNNADFYAVATKTVTQIRKLPLVF